MHLQRRARWAASILLAGGGALLLVVGVPLYGALTFHVLILESMGDEVVNEAHVVSFMPLVQHPGLLLRSHKRYV